MTDRAVRILVPVDFSDASHRAVELAVAWARRSACELHLAHVVDRPREGLQRAEEELAAVTTGGVPVAERHVETGAPAAAIAELAARASIELVVMGTHGRGGMARLFLGSVASEVVRLAPCPVVCVPSSVTRSVHAVPRVLCAVDFSDPSRRARDATADLAPRLGLGVDLLHVLDSPVVEDREQADHALAAWCAAASERGARVESVLTLGSPAEEIVRAARDRACELIAIATHGRTGLTRVALGSVAERVIADAPCPVLTVGPAYRVTP